MHQLLDAELGIEQPAPDRAGDDEGDRQRIEEDRAQHVFAAHALVDQDRQQQAERHRQQHEADAEDHEVDIGDLEIRGARARRNSCAGPPRYSPAAAWRRVNDTQSGPEREHHDVCAARPAAAARSHHGQGGQRATPQAGGLRHDARATAWQLSAPPILPHARDRRGQLLLPFWRREWRCRARTRSARRSSPR